MRRIYEAVKFLDIGTGDRLGHCTALGYDIKTWINNHPTIHMNLIDILDDKVFEWHVLRNDDEIDYNRINELEQIISQLSYEIFGNVISPSILVEAWFRRSKVESHDSIRYSEDNFVPTWIKAQGRIMEKSKRHGTHNVINSLELLEELSNKYSCDTEYSDIQLPEGIADRITNEYLFCKHTINNFLKSKPVDMLNELKHIEKLQNKMIDLVKNRGITIESNPTSNWLIGGFERITDVPCIQWILKRKDLVFTISTDDPAVFGNSIENEYYMVYSSIIKGNESYAGVSRKEGIDVVRTLRTRSLETCFI